jgi:malate/lactate dehydrogenase
MVAACLGPGLETWPASVMLAGEYGIEGVSLSVPVSLTAGGAQRIQEWTLSDDQLGGLRAGAEFVRAAAADLLRPSPPAVP